MSYLSSAKLQRKGRTQLMKFKISFSSSTAVFFNFGVANDRDFFVISKGLTLHTSIINIEEVERILLVTKKSGNRERCRKLSLWNRSVDDISPTRFPTAFLCYQEDAWRSCFLLLLSARANHLCPPRREDRTQVSSANDGWCCGNNYKLNI